MIEKMVQEALARLRERINRSAGQHARAVAKSFSVLRRTHEADIRHPT